MPNNLSEKPTEQGVINPFERYFAKLSADAKEIGRLTIKAFDLKEGGTIKFPLEVAALGVFPGTERLEEKGGSPVNITYENGDPKVDSKHPGWRTPLLGSLGAFLVYKVTKNSSSYLAYRDKASAVTIQFVDLSIKGRGNTSSPVLNGMLADGIFIPDTGLYMHRVTSQAKPDNDYQRPIPVYEGLISLGKTDLDR